MTVLDLFRLDGRVAVVTGASSGLGAGFALALAEAGADVVIAARRVDRLTETAERVRATGRRALAVPTDVTDPTQCERLAQAAVDELGRLDILVNNAGTGTAVPALREPPEQFRSVVEVNLLGAYWAAQSCARRMPSGSAILNVSSVLGLVGGPFPQAAYAASKAGLIGLTRDLSNQWVGRKGIRVNAIAPGYVPSELSDQVPRDRLAEFIQTRCPMGRLGTQAEMNGAMLFLVSPASGYVSGVTLAADGGITGH